MSKNTYIPITKKFIIVVRCDVSSIYADVNEFLNNVDKMKIASTECDEYDIEAEAILINFDPRMSVNDVAELFTFCFDHFFAMMCVLTYDEACVLHGILNQQM